MYNFYIIILVDYIIIPYNSRYLYPTISNNFYMNKLLGII